MKYKRLHIRVPVTGGVLLSQTERITVEADIINVSAGGICIASPSQLLEDGEYNVELLVPSSGKIVFSGFPVYQTEDCVGLKIISINPDHLKKIYQLVEGFQLTLDFIHHIDQGDILNDWVADESGDEIAITFEAS